jgi:regulator of sigma E protease
MSGLFTIFGWDSATVISILLGVVALGVVVFVHELGHFIIAKLCGIRVEVFSIGFPPKLWGFKRGETEYRISWIFVGGYVKLAGMEFEEGIDPRTVKDGYYASPLRVKTALCAAGPLMNLLSAFLIYSYLFVAGYPVPANMEQTLIGGVLENSPAARAGILPGDRVTAVNGEPVAHWEEVTKSIMYSTAGAVAVRVNRAGETIEKDIVPEKDERLNVKLIGILPVEYIAVDVLDGSPAQKAGMRNGDFIMSAAGGKLYSWEELVELIKANEGKPVELGILRNGTAEKITVIPQLNDELGYPAIGIERLLTVSMETFEANGLVSYLHRNPFSWIAHNMRDMYLTIRGLILRAVSPRGLMSPIGIIHVMSLVMRTGFKQFLFLLAFISVNLAVLNLLPIPVLDGGHIAIAIIEAIKRSPLSVRTLSLVQNIFLVLLMGFMLFLIGNDIVRYWGESIARLFGYAGERPPAQLLREEP